MNLIQAAVQAVLPSKRKTTTGGWTSFNAVCCHHRGEKSDTRMRGGIIFAEDSFVYSCFNCSFSAGWSPGKLLSKNTKDLFKWLGMPDSEIQKLSLEALREKDDIPVATKTFSFELHDVALPDNSKPLIEWAAEGCDEPEFISCVEYILNRGLTLDDYNWHWSPSDGFKDRVLIPFYYRGKIVGYTGRKLKPGKPKYLSHSQNGYVFNEDAQTPDRAVVIVVEGQFDAIAISGVAIMNNNPGDVQIARINALGREVIVVPDRDKAGAVMIDAALKHDWSVSFPPWGDDVKDVADAVKKYGKIYTLSVILHYKESNKLKIEILKKRLEKLTHEF